MRYAAFLRGVSPMNARMSELAKAFAAAGFEEVRTVLGSGNVVFRAAAGSESSVERDAEAAMQEKLGRVFLAIVRSVDSLDRMINDDPFSSHKLAPASKRIVTFLSVKPDPKLKLPSAVDGARILEVRNREVLTAYVPSPKGPVFMRLIEKAFGQDVTTRTWETVKKVAAAGRQ
jgi:uncharacterized protein (DUF1697 family)